MSLFLCLRQTSLHTLGFKPVGKSFLRRLKERLPSGCLAVDINSSGLEDRTWSAYFKIDWTFRG